MNRAHSLAPYIPRPYSMGLLHMGICERPGIPTSDATVPSGVISQPIAIIDKSQLRRTWEEFKYHVDVCRVTDGAHIKHP
jgi:hypothetical protein